MFPLLLGRRIQPLAKSLLMVLFPDSHLTPGSGWTASERKQEKITHLCVCVCGFGMGLGMQNGLGFVVLVVSQPPIIFQGKTASFKKTSCTNAYHSALICNLRNLQVSFFLQNICACIKQDCFQDI